jgi:hypothetical protein
MKKIPEGEGTEGRVKCTLNGTADPLARKLQKGEYLDS